MKLWLLRAQKNLPRGDDPWEPWYDKTFGFVVRAETEKEARKFAHDNAGDENRGRLFSNKAAATKTPWLEAKYSTCTELSVKGDIGVVLKDFQAG